MTTVLISSTRESAELSLGPVRDTGECTHYQAGLKCGVLSAWVEVCDLDTQEHLVQFFAELGEKWRSGWEDEKIYSSLEGHLELCATRDKLGHVALRVTLQDDPEGSDWITSGTLEVDAGQLPEIARGISDAFRRSSGV